MSRDGPDATRTDDARSAIATIANSGSRRDYVITFRRRLAGARPTTVTLRYVPDKWLIVAAALAAHLDAIAAAAGTAAEPLALALLDDVNDEVVPRWIEVTVDVMGEGDGAAPLGHRVTIEDRQPGWTDPSALLTRLGPA